MNAPAIVREIGAAPPLVWPDGLTEQVDRVRELWSLLPASPGLDAGGTGRYAHAVQHEQWWKALQHARRGCLETFARAQGWAVSGHDCSAWALMRDRPPRAERGTVPAWADVLRDGRSVYDHPEWLTAAGRPAGVVVHPYYAPVDVDEIPAGVIVDRLPASWYYPALTSAYVLRPAARG